MILNIFARCLQDLCSISTQGNDNLGSGSRAFSAKFYIILIDYKKVYIHWPEY